MPTGRDAASLHKSEPTTVDPADVHKSRPENVWISGMRQETAHTLSAAFSIPPAPGRPRFVELMEVQRQAGMLQLHRQLEVSHDDVLVLDRIGLRFIVDGVAGKDAVRRGVVRSHLVAAPDRRTRRTSRQRFGIEIARGLVALGRSQVRVLSRPLYLRLRNRADDLQASAGDAAPTGFTPLTIAATDRLASDHLSDHVTAMQLAAALEASIAGARPDSFVTSLKLAFHTYTEPATRPLVRSSDRGRRIDGEVSQGGLLRAHFSARVEASDRREP